MRLFAATLATETNAFSPLPTSLASYRETVFLLPGEHPEDASSMCTAPLIFARRAVRPDGFTIAKPGIHVDSDRPPQPRLPTKIDYVKVNRPIWPLDEDTRPRLI